jgi:hypothetical protein
MMIVPSGWPIVGSNRSRLVGYVLDLDHALNGCGVFGDFSQGFRSFMAAFNLLTQVEARAGQRMRF